MPLAKSASAGMACQHVGIFGHIGMARHGADHHIVAVFLHTGQLGNAAQVHDLFGAEVRRSFIEASRVWPPASSLPPAPASLTASAARRGVQR
jgi:hypothetical protein